MTERYDEIQGITGFDQGDKFTSEKQVRAYFNRAALAVCLIGSLELVNALPDQETLDSMADDVIANGWHCAFEGAKS